MLDEHLLRELVRLLHVRIMVALAYFPDLRELFEAQGASGLAKRLEGVLGLSAQHDVADESVEIVILDDIGQIASDSQCDARRLFDEAVIRPNRALVVL